MDDHQLSLYPQTCMFTVCVYYRGRRVSPVRSIVFKIFKNGQSNRVSGYERLVLNIAIALSRNIHELTVQVDFFFRRKSCA